MSALLFAIRRLAQSHPRFISALLLALLTCVAEQSAYAGQDQYLIKSRATRREVSFKTEDGWQIFGTLTVPEKLPEGSKLPAALLLHGGEHDQSVFDTYPGWVKIQESLVTLRIDLRGRGKSRGSLESHSFTSAQRAQVFLDVKAAIAVLEAQPNVDTRRIGIVAEESAADAAVQGATGNPHIRVMVFLSGRLEERSREYLAANDQIAILGVVSKEDRTSFADMTAIYGQSKNEASDVFILDDLGIGAAMGSVWRDRFPNEKPIDFTIGEWLVDRLGVLGKRTEVSFQSADGYALHADLILPEKASADHKVPGVVLLHSALGDRHIFESLGQSLARNGIAVLAVDWRGRGQSIEKGYHFDLSKAEREKTPLDVLAAIRFLKTATGVDGNRLGILGLVLSAKYAMLAAASDKEVKTLVVMTGFIPGDAEIQSINSLKLPILYLLSAGRPRVTKAMMDHFARTQSNGSQVFSFEGGTHGFHLLEMDKSWEPIIVRWFATHLEDR